MKIWGLEVDGMIKVKNLLYQTNIFDVYFVVL